VKLQHYARQHPRATVAVAVAVVLVVLYLNRPMVSATLSSKLGLYPTHERNHFTSFFAVVEKMGYVVNVTSTWRPSIAGEPAIHSLWRAIDVNLLHVTTGKVYTKSTSKAEWLATGIPQLARSMNMRWGGDFTTPYVYKGTTYAGYDPIHFDLGYPA